MGILIQKGNNLDDNKYFVEVEWNEVKYRCDVDEYIPVTDSVIQQPMVMQSPFVGVITFNGYLKKSDALGVHTERNIFATEVPLN